MTITGTKHHCGTREFYIGQSLLLVKDPSNTHDEEAIMAVMLLQLDEKYVQEKMSIFIETDTFFEEEDEKEDVDQIHFTEKIVGYVANSSFTVARGTRSAGRIYDTFGQWIFGQIVFVVGDRVIVEIA